MTPKTNQWFQHSVRTYGDLLFDLCQSVLWSPESAPYAYRLILKNLKAKEHGPRFEKYERAWVLHSAYDILSRLAEKSPRRLTPAEQVMLDSNPEPKTRLRYFDSYFHRLPVDSQFALILKDKYGIPLPEVATVMELPLESLKLKRLQALRLLKDWIWGVPNAVL